MTMPFTYRADCFDPDAEVCSAESFREAIASLEARMRELAGLLEEARSQTRHSDYDWPLDLCHRIDAAMNKESGK